MSALTEQQLQVLMAPLKQGRISHRSQGGRQLSYLEAWDVKAMLIRVFGFGGFSADLLEYRIEHAIEVPHPKKEGAMLWNIAVSARLCLAIHSLGVTYTEAAAAMQAGPDFGEVLDFAIKTAESDALKRAAINLGTQFGLSLYNNGATRDVVQVIVAPDQKWEYGTKPPESTATEQPGAEVGTATNPARNPEEASAMIQRSLGVKQ